jgi:hypothetical protein
MLSSHRNKVVAVIATLVVVVGAGGAIAATGALSPKEQSEAIVNDAAEELGVQPSELTAALKTALKNQVDAAVQAGALTDAEGQAMKERIDAGEVPLFGRGPGPGHHRGPGLHGGLDSAADYLGMTEAQLRTALNGGTTLAQLAKNKDKSVDGLVAAMEADAKAKLAAAVKDGRLTQAESQAMQADLKARITAMVNNARFEHRERGPVPEQGASLVLPTA